MKIQNSTELGVANLERLRQTEEDRLDKAREVALAQQAAHDSKVKQFVSACSNLQYAVEANKNKVLNDPMVQIGLQCLQCCTWICGLQNDNKLQKYTDNNQRILITPHMKRK